MKKRYIFSMLGLFPFIVIVDGIYFVYHRSPAIFLTELGEIQLKGKEKSVRVYSVKET